MPTLDQVNIFKESAAAGSAVVFLLAFLFMLRLYVKQNKEHREEVRALHKERIAAGAAQVQQLNSIITMLSSKGRQRKTTPEGEATGEHAPVKAAGEG